MRIEKANESHSSLSSKQHYLSENKTSFIISLLLHLLFLLFLFFNAFKEKNKITIVTAKKKERGQQLSALLPKKSDHGTQILFDDSVILPPMPQEETKKVTKKEAIPKKKQAEKKQLVKKKEETKPVEKIQEKKALQTSIPELPKTGLKKVEKKAKITKRKQDQKTKTEKPVPKTTIPTDWGRLALNNLMKEETTKKEPIPNKLKPTVKRKQKKKKSLLSLTKTYLDHEKGNSCLMRHGADRFPDLKELKYICYEKKIQDHIISSWRAIRGNSTIHVEGQVSLTFLINKNGRVENLILLGSSGSPEFDEMVLESIKNTIFPPIPKHFGVEKYRPRGGYTLLPSF